MLGGGLEYVESNDPMSQWLKATNFKERACLMLMATEFEFNYMQFGKLGSNYVLRIALDKELKDSEMARWAEIEGQIQEASRETKPSHLGELKLATTIGTIQVL